MRHFVQFVSAGATPLPANFESSAQRERQRGWSLRVIEGPHEAMYGKRPETAPVIAELLAAPYRALGIRQGSVA